MYSRLTRWPFRSLLVMAAVVVSIAAPAGASSAVPASAADVADPDPPLIEAVKRQDTEAVARLLASGVDPDVRQSDGATALHWAVHREDAETVTLLIEAGADVDAVNRLGASALFLAAQGGNATMLRRLLESGADPNLALPLGETLVMTAARSGTVQGVRDLIQAGADINLSERSRGQTALMWAAAQGHHKVVQALIEADVNIAARSTVRPRLMYTDATNGGAFDQGMVENLGGFSALLFAARQGDTAIADLLLTAGADVDGQAGNGASPLVVAIHSGHPALARLLLERGADPDAIDAGYNALHAAVLRGDLDSVVALLEHGADPDVRLLRATPVQRASEDWALKTAMVSATPFWLAATFREAEIMHALAEGGADPTLNTTELWRKGRERSDRDEPSEPRVAGGFVSPLQAAVRGASDRGRFYILPNDDPVGEERLALAAVTVGADLGIDLDHADFTGAMALHDAAQRNLTSIVRFLAERGADVNATNGRGRTPLDVAVTSSRFPSFASLGPDWSGPNAIDILEEFGAVRSNQSARRR